MPRMPGIEMDQAGWILRIVYRFVKRKVRQRTGTARLIAPARINAHHPRLFAATFQMEIGQEKARSLPESLKTLATVRAAMLVGCHF